ncbi:MAG: DUF1631 family protein [Moraxellaceae bacterium]|nr:DUF1631 family protein [Moraxellaceae bacterium]
METLNKPAILRRCRERFADTLLKAATSQGIRLPELLQALSDAAGATFDELSGIRNRREFEAKRSLTASRISLVHPEDMDLTVALINLSQKLTDRAERSLSSLHLRFMTLLEQDDADVAQLPIGPDAVCAALREMLDHDAMRGPGRLSFPAQAETALSNSLAELYVELDKLLEDAGVEQKSLLRTAGERAPFGGPGLERAAYNGSTVDGAAPLDAGPGIPGPLGALRSALWSRSASTGGDGPRAGIDPTLASAIADRVLGWLTEKQRDATAAGALNVGELNLLLPPASAVSLDALGRAFDVVLADARLCPALRPVLASLRVPLFKAALIAPGFLADATHPARQCLDALLGLAMSIDPRETESYAIVRSLREQSADFVAHFDRDLTAFEGFRGQLDALAAQHMATAVSRATALIPLAEREVRREQARRRAAQAVRALTVGDVPEPVRDFLEQLWVRVLATVLQTQGEKSPQWMQGLATADRLIWSMQPKTEPAARAELVAALPPLLEQLRQGLTLIGMPEAMREQVLNRFVAFHSAALRGRGMEDIAGFGIPRLAPPRVDTVTEHPGLRLVRLQPDAEAEPRAPDWIAALKVGDWLDIKLPDGSGARTRVAWLAGQARTLLVTHPHGDFAAIFPLRWLITQAQRGDAAGVPTSQVLEQAAAEAARRL